MTNFTVSPLQKVLLTMGRTARLMRKEIAAEREAAIKWNPYREPESKAVTPQDVIDFAGKNHTVNQKLETAKSLVSINYGKVDTRPFNVMDMINYNPNSRIWFSACDRIQEGIANLANKGTTRASLQEAKEKIVKGWPITP